MVAFARPATRWPVRWGCSGHRGPDPAAHRCAYRRDPAADEDNYTGPTINRTARLRDLAHGGQTVLSGATNVGGRSAPRGHVAHRFGHPPVA